MFDKRKLEELEREKRKWEDEVVKKALERFPERKKEFKTASNIEVKRLHTPADVSNVDYLKDLGFPGMYPYTRGVYPTMYRGRLWTIRQYAGFATAEETNRRFKYLLEQGQTGLSIAFDLPTQIGYDSDHSMARGEVGKVGVSVNSLEDMEILFNGIPLDKVSTSMTINSTAAMLLAMYAAVGEKQGVALDKLAGTIQNDMLKEYVARGTHIFPPEPSMRLAIDIIEYCSKNMPRFHPISISGYHIREAGSTAVQELAFTLANGIAYVDAAMKRGLDVDEFAPRLSFFFAAHNDLFEEVAKFRAARRLWARIMKERFGAKKPTSWLLRFHVQTGGSTLTAQQPDNNVVRATIQALAAVLGGTQSLHTCSKDEAWALPSEEAVRISVRTQQILAHESGVTETVDPLAGSYYVESLTNKLEEEALKYIERIDALGGAMKAIERGYIQREIQESAYRYQREVESKQRIIVGVNQFTTEEEVPVKLLRVKPEVEKLQRERLKKLKERRDRGKVGATLEGLRRAAEGDENLMPSILEAVKAYATIGEVCSVLRDVFGEYKAPTVI
jgi:methylmalonyl-CoA mutase N-terminal domain/subunit